MRDGQGPLYVETAVALPVDGVFVYHLPAHLRAGVGVGTGLVVPFGPRQVSAFVLRLLDAPPEGITDIKDVQGRLTAEPLFDPARLSMYQFMARYYAAPIGDVVRTALPPGILRATIRTARLTDAGRAALENHEVTPCAQPALRAVLARLAGTADVQIATLVKLAGGKKSVVDAAERAGWIEVESRLPDAAVRVKTERHFTVPAGGDASASAIRGARRIEIRQAVCDAPNGLTATQLRERFGASATAPIAALVRDGHLIESRREVYRLSEAIPDTSPVPDLTADQARAVKAVEPAVAEGRGEVFLLMGVTGSGKTEVYLRLVERALAAGRGAVVLVPEIALTPQLLGRFVGRFGDVVAAGHSGLSAGERFDLWRRVARREIRVVVGARSALFAPMPDVGLLVVDEEHDGSYKQDEGLPYNARDLAVWAARGFGCPVVLGSATPSLESRFAAQEGRYTLLRLDRRVHERPLPPVTIVDLRPLEIERAGRRREKTGDELPHARVIFSDLLASEIGRNLDAGEQTILLHNRRGYSTHLFCLKCGSPAHCPDCDVSLTFHLVRGLAVCHTCDREGPPPATCRVCGADRIFFAGLGTEQVEHELTRLFPRARVARMDRDTVKGKAGHERVLSPFRAGHADILLGTQMVAKGHDFPGVTLVGILQADTSLAVPDFRSSERTFQLVTQVAGRAGRAEKPGRIVLQTYQPDHYAVACAAGHDYERFYGLELERRRAAGYPPFARLALVRVTGPERDATLLAAVAGATAGRRSAARRGLDREAVLGPARSPIARIKNRYRFQLLLRAPKPADLLTLVGIVEKAARAHAGPGVDVRVDVDSQNMM